MQPTDEAIQQLVKEQLISEGRWLDGYVVDVRFVYELAGECFYRARVITEGRDRFFRMKISMIEEL
jgi:hypothetical protein